MAPVVSGTPRDESLAFVRGRRVLVTGHTGFKGAWLAEWLLQLGADVTGIALEPEPGAPLFHALELRGRLRHVVADIRDASLVGRTVREARPEIVFHLAAQPLVRRSYREPLLTWETNVQGTLNVLEGVRAAGAPAAFVAVTTDKVYRNREWTWAYREVDELGGHDPYSASKAACELAVASWRASFGADSGITVATARAGNVLGAGDFAEDRVVPDCYRGWSAGAPARLRNPGSTRPWQHVLEPLSGYLSLAHHLGQADSRALDTCNFGPGPGGDRTVGELVDGLAALGDGRAWVDESVGDGAPHEAGRLSLSIDRARHELGWAPRLSFDETLRWVDAGYAAPAGRLAQVVREQIAQYQQRCMA